MRYISPDGSKGTISLLVSKDGKKLAQFTKFDISVDPKLKFVAGDRPARGGPANAPVLVTVYDDLECPFCARLNEELELFPGLLNRDKDSVQVVYRDFPIEGHPWAMHAAVDVECVAEQSVPAYWASVDDIHRHFAYYGGSARSLALAENEIDSEVKHQGQLFHLDPAKLDGCVAKQDTRPEIDSIHEGEQVGVESTPTLFINGVKVVGAQPLPYIFGIIDDSLRAEGVSPPPYTKGTEIVSTPK